MTDTTPTTQSPHIEATVVRSAEGPYIGHISVDGAVSTVEGRTEDGVRRDIIRAVAGVAQRLSHPVRLVARDSLGVQTVSVNPDGYTEALTPVTPAAPATSAPDGGLDFDAIVDPGRNTGQGPVSDDDTLPRSSRRGSAIPDLEYLFHSQDDDDDDVDEVTDASPVSAATSLAADPQPTTRIPTMPSYAPRVTPTAAPAHSAATTPPPAASAPALAAPAAAAGATAASASSAAPATPAATPTPAAAATPTTPAAPTTDRTPSFDPVARLREPEPATPTPPEHLPTLSDFMATRPESPMSPAERGWQGALRRLSGGLINPAPGAAELAHRKAVEAVQRSFSGPRTVVVINPKGGAHKTTATMLLASTFGQYRGGYTLAWDNNETRGTLGWRALPAAHSNTAVSLLHDLDRFADPTRARVGDLDDYVRSQGSAQFDVLASDEDPMATDRIDADAFRRLHETLQRFYRVILIDTGNNMRAANWLAAVEAADQLVIVSTVREDTAASAAWLVDGLREKGLGDKVRDAVTVLSATSAQTDPQLSRRLHGHFGSLTRAVLDVPHDVALVDGGAINFDLLSRNTREAWLDVAATVAEGL
ncbi:MinD/ParA family ATP-binding protein [Gryllotalpicola ginsengisoli]|uniref:MinD/ParA family ATP-binding protein n=1 Tax=Gryllotalpicola ginsengisoli TaxID=444608 RepID=UPI0003B6FE27|nr:cobalamin biosynthesis protein CobQ [Gryllotalpicola ginsengisoli]